MLWGERHADPFSCRRLPISTLRKLYLQRRRASRSPPIGGGQGGANQRDTLDAAAPLNRESYGRARFSFQGEVYGHWRHRANVTAVDEQELVADTKTTSRGRVTTGGFTHGDATIGLALHQNGSDRTLGCRGTSQER